MPDKYLVKGEAKLSEKELMKKKTGDPKEERIHAFRKEVAEIFVLNIKNVKTQEVLFSRAEVLDISVTGLLLLVKRDEIVALSLRSTLTMSLLHDIRAGFTIEVMDNYIEGIIKRTKSRGRGEFLIAVDFTDDAPEYWRESLVDLLPEKSDLFDDEENESDEDKEDYSDIEPQDGDEE